MSPDPRTAAQSALQQAMQALRRGDRKTAREQAQLAISLVPNLEDPWLILAAAADPQDSLTYLRRALEINPQSERARQGMHWALQRIRTNPSPTQDQPPPASKPAPPAPAEIPVPQAVQQVTPPLPASPQVDQPANPTPAPPISAVSSPVPEAVQPRITKRDIKPIPVQDLTRRRTNYLPLLLVMLIFGGGLVAWAGAPTILRTLFVQPAVAKPMVPLFKPSLTPTATNTPTPTPTSTPTPTPTNTPTPTPTFTPTPTPTQTPTPTDTLPPPPTQSLPEPEGSFIPKDVTSSTRWIDVDLSQQMVYAYVGSDVVASFLVSTGTWAHPTVQGEFHIYVKYRYTTMSGPGYYLTNVPYTMYFYDGYGLHGTYWHHNFGTPMSHGCVNLRTEDAGWLYGWADVGTLVNVHE